MSIINRVHAASVVANVNGNPITDIDITERVKIIPEALDNRGRAKDAIIDDYVKLEYARQFKLEPTDKEVDAAMKEHRDNPQMKFFTRATLAWQAVIIRTIVPTISVGEKEINQELSDLERERGLPIEMTFLRLVDIPDDVYKKLEKPKSCADAGAAVRKLGGEPQKITALEYELSIDVRKNLVGLSDLTWSPLVDKKTYLICNRKKTDEWGGLDEIIKQNAIYKRAFFQADQLLKQLRRKAVIN
ncbi:MAG: hypothetical protein LBD94_02590 [Rickettsiales bacterium]|nr:hypothetical protein [Rickettsiales bacterium]